MKNLILSILYLAPNINPIIQPILDAFNAWLFPVLMAVLTVIGIPTFVKKALALAKSDDENQRMAAQKSLITAIVAFVLVFVLLVAFRLAMPILQEWVEGIV